MVVRMISKVMMRGYVANAKLPLTIMLLFTALCSGLVAHILYNRTSSFLPLFVSLVALTFVIIASNYFTSITDQDLDGKMERTKNRPITRNIVSEESILFLGCIFLCMGLLLAILINIDVLFWILFGLIMNNIVYSVLLKRRTSLNIVIGAPSGGAPVMAAWTAVLGANHLILPVLMAGLIVAWTPTHIWSLAIRYKEDYQRAGVPMLPVIASEKSVTRCIATSSLFLPVLVLFFFYFTNHSSIFILIAVGISLLFMILCIWLLFFPTKEKAWQLFKISSPYLVVIFVFFVFSV